MSLPSASKLQLAATCPASSALPQDGFAHPAGDEGTRLHDLLDRALEARKNGDAPTPDPWLDGVLEAVGGALDGAAELAYGYDPTSGAAYLYGSRIGRHYPARETPTTLRGTVDYVAPRDGGWLVVDLKTGLGDEVRVAQNWQLRFAALAVGAWHSPDPVATAILHAPRDGSRPWWEWGPLYDGLALAGLRDELAGVVAAIQRAERDVRDGKTPRLVQGPHCGQCPARRSCPAMTGLVRAWATRPQETKAELHHLLDVETAGLAWSRIQAAKAVLAEAERQVYAFASIQPVPLPDGQMLGKHRRRGRDVADAERAWPVLVERYGPDVAREAMSLKTSRTALRKAAEGRAARGRKREAGDAFVRELEAAGILAEKWSEEVGVYDPTDPDTQTQSAQPALADGAGASPPPAPLVLVPPEGQGQENN